MLAFFNEEGKGVRATSGHTGAVVHRQSIMTSARRRTNRSGGHGGSTERTMNEGQSAGAISSALQPTTLKIICALPWLVFSCTCDRYGDVTSPTTTVGVCGTIPMCSTSPTPAGWASASCQNGPRCFATISGAPALAAPSHTRVIGRLSS